MIVFSAESLFSISNRLYEIMQMFFLFIVCGVSKKSFQTEVQRKLCGCLILKLLKTSLYMTCFTIAMDFCSDCKVIFTCVVLIFSFCSVESERGLYGSLGVRSSSF